MIRMRRASRAMTFRNGATWMPAPAAVARHDWREHRGWENANAYQNYGNRGYYGSGCDTMVRRLIP